GILHEVDQAKENPRFGGVRKAGPQPCGIALQRCFTNDSPSCGCRGFGAGHALQGDASATPVSSRYEFESLVDTYLNEYVYQQVQAWRARKINAGAGATRSGE